MAKAADQASQYEVIARLRQFGHLPRIAVEDLPRLSLDSPEVREGLDSFLAFSGYELRAGATGGIDRLAIGAVMQPRCGCSDFEGVGELDEASAEMEATTGSGSWPAGCHPDFPGRHTFTVQFDFRGMPSYLGNPDDPTSPFRQAWELCRAAYADMGIAFIPRNDSRANTLVTWQRGAGWLGLAIVGRSQTCGSRIWAKYDNRYRPSALVHQWARLFAHEFGHNMGFSHLRGGIMNPSLSQGEFTPRAWRGDPGESRMRSWFGGEPVPLGPLPGPGPDPNPGNRFDWQGAKIA